MIVMGVDPGSRCTGYAVVEKKNSRYHLIEGGIISTVSNSKSSPKYQLDISQRLLIIHNELADIIDKYNPDAAAIESIFSYKSSEAAIRLGQARGIALMTFAQKGLSVETYNPMTVKKSVGGHGKSGKDEMIRMTSRLLQLDKPLSSDAADAVAIAITHIIKSSLHNRIYKNQIQKSEQPTNMTANQKRIVELQRNITLGKNHRTNRSKPTDLQDWLNHRPKQEK